MEMLPQLRCNVPAYKLPSNPIAVTGIDLSFWEAFTHGKQISKTGYTIKGGAAQG